MTTSTKKTISYLLKASIVIVAGLFIYRQFSKKSTELQEFELLASNLSVSRVVFTLGIVVLLMFLNWFLEALKWRYVTKALIAISLWEAVEAVFCGLTWAVTTPNRIGEYGGRVMFLPNRKRIPGVFAMGVGAFSQALITNILGIISSVWFVLSFINDKKWAYITVVAILGVLVLLQLIVYFHIKWMVYLFDKIAFIRKYHRFFDVLSRYKTNELLKTMAFSLARYATFTFQYYLVFQLLVPQVSIIPMLLVLMVFFFVTSTLPSLDLFDIGVRGFTAAHLFIYVTDQKLAVISCVSLIWLINLFIPAILGSLFVFKLKFFDRNA